MSNTNNVRNDIKQVAQIIEKLAQQIQTGIDQGLPIMATANELVRNNSTFTFTLGALYALEQPKSVKTTTVSNPSGTTTHKYHNVRDSLGRFAKI